MMHLLRSVLNWLSLGTLRRMEQAERRYSQKQEHRNPIERTILGNRGRE